MKVQKSEAVRRRRPFVQLFDCWCFFCVCSDSDPIWIRIRWINVCVCVCVRSAVCVCEKELPSVPTAWLVDLVSVVLSSGSAGVSVLSIASMKSVLSLRRLFDNDVKSEKGTRAVQKKCGSSSSRCARATCLSVCLSMLCDRLTVSSSFSFVSVLRRLCFVFCSFELFFVCFHFVYVAARSSNIGFVCDVRWCRHHCLSSRGFSVFLFSAVGKASPWRGDSARRCVIQSGVDSARSRWSVVPIFLPFSFAFVFYFSVRLHVPTYWVRLLLHAKNELSRSSRFLHLCTNSLKCPQHQSAAIHGRTVPVDFNCCFLLFAYHLSLRSIPEFHFSLVWELCNRALQMDIVFPEKRIHKILLANAAMLKMSSCVG